MAVDALAEKLSLLLNQGYLAESRFTARDHSRLQSLFEAEVLQEARSGAGKRIILKSVESLEAFIAKTYPSGLEGTGENLSPRSKAVAELRDSKKARETQPIAVLLRGFNNSVLHHKNQVLPVACWSETAGVASLCLNGETQWGFTGIIAFVENLEVFWNFEKLGIPVDLAIYTQGRLNSKVLTWLASPAMEHARLIHCGDYDPVGLDEFLRLKAVCPGRTEIYLPPDLESLLSRYGKKELLIDNVAILERLRKSDDQQVRLIVKMMDHWGVGLEQEVLLK